MKNAHFNGYWSKCYNGMEPDQPGILDEPVVKENQELFCEAMMYIAKLYDLEGLNKQDDKKAQEYFKKACVQADKARDTILHSWIEIHIAELAPRLDLKPEVYYNNALAPFNNLDIETFESSSKRSDLVNLMSTCYYELGRLDRFNQSINPNIGVNWYQKQLELANKYKLLDFQVRAHVELANIDIFQGFTQTTSSDATKNFQNAYEHVKNAWNINKDFSNEGSGVIEASVLAEMMINIMDELIRVIP